MTYFDYWAKVVKYHCVFPTLQPHSSFKLKWKEFMVIWKVEEEATRFH
jgi:hypothetical protein